MGRLKKNISDEPVPEVPASMPIAFHGEENRAVKDNRIYFENLKIDFSKLLPFNTLPKLDSKLSFQLYVLSQVIRKMCQCLHNIPSENIKTEATAYRLFDVFNEDSFNHFCASVKGDNKFPQRNDRTAWSQWSNSQRLLYFLRTYCLPFPVKLERFQKGLLSIADYLESQVPKRDKFVLAFKRKIDEICKMFLFNELEKSIFTFLVTHDRINASWQTMSDVENYKIITYYFSIPTSEVLKIGKKFNNLNLTEENFNLLNGKTRDYFQTESTLTIKDIQEVYFKSLDEAIIPMEKHGEIMEQHLPILEKIFKGYKAGEPFNILLYGEPGTGKTSFAHSLAKHFDACASLIAQNSITEDQEEVLCDSSYRFAALQICDRQKVDRKWMIVDEADNLMDSNSGGLFSFWGTAPVDKTKGTMNTVMESLHHPCIWITNCDSGRIAESTKRRFSYAIKFDKLSPQRRKHIWKSAVEIKKLEGIISDELIETMNDKYPISAGGVDLALTAVKRAMEKQKKMDTKDASYLMEDVLKSHCKLMDIDINSKSDKRRRFYSLEALNIKGSISLESIVKAVKRFHYGEGKRVTMLFSGAPGSGKTEFVKYLGQESGLPVITKMGSDLLDMYVGNSEKLIRAAFQQAAASKSILFMDEIDGLLRSRAGARNSWEVTQVNEILHQMEIFEGILVCATNHGKNLDPASIRRFAFKLNFEYATDEGKELLYQKYFGALSKSGLRVLQKINRMTHGDFYIVYNKFEQLDILKDLDEEKVLETLAQEIDMKLDGSNQIGF